MPRIARLRSMTSLSFALPPAARCDRPVQASARTDGDQPGRFAQGPEENKARFGFLSGLDTTVSLSVNKVASH